MQGIGDVFGIDAQSDDWDLAQLSISQIAAGCSAAFYPGDGTVSGHSLLARNFAFPTLTHSEIVGGTARLGETALAADPWIVDLYPDRGYASMTIGIMDVMVCTNHLLHRWPDPTRLPNDPTRVGTAAFTYQRWRTLHEHTTDGTAVDRADISGHCATFGSRRPLLALGRSGMSPTTWLMHRWRFRSSSGTKPVHRADPFPIDPEPITP